jgi:hypothetical protein
MILFQALAAFCDHIAGPELAARALATAATRQTVLNAMAAAWA